MTSCTLLIMYYVIDEDNNQVELESILNTTNGLRLGNGIITDMNASGLIYSALITSEETPDFSTQFLPLEDEIYKYALIQEDIIFQSRGSTDIDGSSSVTANNFSRYYLDYTSSNNIYTINVSEENVPEVGELFEWQASSESESWINDISTKTWNLILPEGKYIFINNNRDSYSDTVYENFYISRKDKASLLFQYKEGEEFKVKSQATGMGMYPVNLFFQILGKRIA